MHAIFRMRDRIQQHKTRVCSLIGKASTLQVERCQFDSDQYPPNLGGHSSIGRALALHARGQEFDSPWLHDGV